MTTLRYLHDAGARTIILSHLGRPNGKVNLTYSLQPVYDYLKTLVRGHWFFADCIGAPAVDLSRRLEDGDFGSFENVRFHPEEEADDRAFARALAAAGDIDVHAAFRTAHRAHASTAGIAADLRSKTLTGVAVRER